MALGDIIKNSVKKWTGLTLYKKLPIGFDALDNVKTMMKGYSFQTFVDVGANVGQSAEYIRQNFPQVSIHCVEPIKDTFKQLLANTKGLNLHYYNLALGAKKEMVEVEIDHQNANSDRNSLLEKNRSASVAACTKEVVQVTTLTEFCSINNIPFIDYLKIDTEGYDLEVLRGASEMLEHSLVSFIETEVSMNPNNTFHVGFEEVRQYLEKYHYVVFGIYEQVLERRKKVPMLRRANILFIAENLAQRHALEV